MTSPGPKRMGNKVMLCLVSEKIKEERNPREIVKLCQKVCDYQSSEPMDRNHISFCLYIKFATFCLLLSFMAVDYVNNVLEHNYGIATKIR